jgi:integrase
MSNRTPQYRRHHGIYARVKINGRWIHLGKYDDAAAKAKFRQLIAEWAADLPVATVAPAEVSVAEVLEAFRAYAKAYYGDQRGSRYRLLLSTIRTVRELYADLPAREFSPRKLKAVRQAFIDAGFTRGHVNQCVQRVVAMFRWAVEEELVDGSVVHALEAVKPLRRGHTAAPEGKTVSGVQQSVVDATLPLLVPVLADMVRLQLACGARPGEICAITPGAIDRSRDVWLYSPAQHKNAHRGHPRVIALGPIAQAILRRYLLRPADQPCFSPKEALAQFMDREHARRATPMNQGNRPICSKRAQAIAKVHDRYEVAAYRRAIERACDRAFPVPEGAAATDARKWKREHRWTPHRLRHTCGTMVRERYGLDGSQAILGHRSARVSEIYSELNIAKAIEIARRLG